MKGGHAFSNLAVGVGRERMRVEELPLAAIRSARFVHASASAWRFRYGHRLRAGGVRGGAPGRSGHLFDANLRLKLWRSPRARAMISRPRGRGLLPASIEDATRPERPGRSRRRSSTGAPDRGQDGVLKRVNWGVCERRSAPRTRSRSGGALVSTPPAAGDCFCGAALARLAAGDCVWDPRATPNAAAAVVDDRLRAGTRFAAPDAVRRGDGRALRGARQEKGSDPFMGRFYRTVPIKGSDPFCLAPLSPSPSPCARRPSSVVHHVANRDAQVAFPAEGGAGTAATASGCSISSRRRRCRWRP